MSSSVQTSSVLKQSFHKVPTFKTDIENDDNLGSRPELHILEGGVGGPSAGASFNAGMIGIK